MAITLGQIKNKNGQKFTKRRTKLIEEVLIDFHTQSILAQYIKCVLLREGQPKGPQSEKKTLEGITPCNADRNSRARGVRFWPPFK